MLKQSKNKIVFLILHYLSIDYTMKCIESILELDTYGNDVEIVVVDNGSQNGSGNALVSRYKNEQKVHVIELKKNVGFASGNNVGFKYAKYKLNADYIVMINNDVMMVQDCFIKKIVDEYNGSKYAVLGPKILLRNNKINGILHGLQTVKHYKKDLRILKLEYMFSLIYLFPIYEKLKELLKKRLKRSDVNITNWKDEDDSNRYHENIILHGCALIFSEKYIELFDGLEEKTFLYREEELLYLRLMRHRLKNVYNPNIFVYHDEDGTTNMLTKSRRKKRLFIYKNMIKSTKILIEELEKNNNA